MPPSPEIRSRIDGLAQEIWELLEHGRSRSVQNHWISLFLMAIIILSSTVAGIGGLTSKLPSQAIGALAILPSAAALLASTYKFQERSNWHYRHVNDLKELLSRLKYQLPETPTADNVAAIAAAFSALEQKIQADWETKFTMNFSSIARRAKDDVSAPEFN